MSIFLMASGVARTTCDEVEAILRDVAVDRGCSLTKLSENEVAKEGEALYLIASSAGNVTVVYPDCDAWGEVAEIMSTVLKQPAFAFDIYHSDMWMYELYVNGRAVDQFNPIPEYWDHLSPEEIAKWSGSASVVCEHWPGADVNEIESYLVKWPKIIDFSNTTKVQIGDKYGIGDDWQLTDFMAKLGLDLPIDRTGIGNGRRFRLTTTESMKAMQPTKKWWQFWR